jgi:hypothetical protein
VKRDFHVEHLDGENSLRDTVSFSSNEDTTLPRLGRVAGQPSGGPASIRTQPVNACIDVTSNANGQINLLKHTCAYRKHGTP